MNTVNYCDFRLEILNYIHKDNGVTNEYTFKKIKQLIENNFERVARQNFSQYFCTDMKKLQIKIVEEFKTDEATKLSETIEEIFLDFPPLLKC